MTTLREPAALAWSHETTEIPERGLNRTRSATEAERAALAEALALIACDALDVTYQIVPTPAGHWRLTGGLDAAVTQACVISLEPVAARLAETFSVEFRREADEGSAEDEREILSGHDVEPLDGDRIDVGRIVYESLSAALDPYPRKEGAEFDWADPKAGEADTANPFAVLKKLKNES
jgi:uncharacterized metal-binding protein YceD (DUF177 family)